MFVLLMIELFVLYVLQSQGLSEYITYAVYAYMANRVLMGLVYAGLPGKFGMGIEVAIRSGIVANIQILTVVAYTHIMIPEASLAVVMGYPASMTFLFLCVLGGVLAKNKQDNSEVEDVEDRPTK